MQELGILAHVQILGNSDVISGLLQEFGHSNVVRLGQILGNGDIVLNCLKLLLNRASTFEELGDSDVVGSLVQELGHTCV
jgi:hypothetical protein